MNQVSFDQTLTEGRDDARSNEEREYVKHQDYIIERCPRLGLRLLS